MSIKYTTTIYKNNKLKTVTRNTFFVKAPHIEKKIINVFPEIRYQKIYGFGGAITDSAGYVYSLMSFKNKQKLLKEYYSKDSINYTLGRIHLDSCDFSTHKYQAIKNKDLDSMDITDTRRYIIPLIHDIQTYTGKPLEILATPWSPPSFLKTTHLRTFGGKLKKSNMEFYAKYLCKYIQELIKEDINITRITIQNEPQTIQTWDSCIYSTEEEKEFIKNYLYPELEKNHLENIDILIHDHNKDSAYDRAKNVITEETKDIVDGVAFHWYTGDHFDALSAIKDQFPDKDLILSEMCVGYSKEDNILKAQMYAHEYLGDLNHGANALMDWNILLDNKGGPNYVHNFCDAPFMYNKETEELNKRFAATYIWHFSHFIRPNAIRIGNTSYTNDLEVGSFLNDAGDIQIVILNKHNNKYTTNIKLDGKIAKIHIDKQSITTVSINYL